MLLTQRLFKLNTDSASYIIIADDIYQALSKYSSNLQKPSSFSKQFDSSFDLVSDLAVVESIEHLNSQIIM